MDGKNIETSKDKSLDKSSLDKPLKSFEEIKNQEAKDIEKYKAIENSYQNEFNKLNNFGKTEKNSKDYMEKLLLLSEQKSSIEKLIKSNKSLVDSCPKSNICDLDHETFTFIYLKNIFSAMPEMFILGNKGAEISRLKEIYYNNKYQILERLNQLGKLKINESLDYNLLNQRHELLQSMSEQIKNIEKCNSVSFKSRRI